MQIEDITLDVDTRALDDALSRLPMVMQKKVLRKALEAAGDVLLESIRGHAPERQQDTPGGSIPPGILRADLHTDVEVSEKSGAVVRIGPTTITGHVARWINNGFTLTTHGSKRGRSAVKRKDGKPNPIPGTYFMERGTDEASERALEVLTSTIAEGIGIALHQVSTGFEGDGKDEDYGGENY